MTEVLTSLIALSLISITANAAAADFAAPTIGLSVAMSTVTLQKSAGLTCTRSAVPALRIDLGQLKLEWKSTAALQSSAVVLAFENPNLKGGQYICEITGAEFDAVFGTQGANVDATVSSVTGCNIQCGGIETIPNAPAFSMTGSVSVFGTTQIGSASRVQQHASIPMTINYAP